MKTKKKFADRKALLKLVAVLVSVLLIVTTVAPYGAALAENAADDVAEVSAEVIFEDAEADAAEAPDMEAAADIEVPAAEEEEEAVTEVLPEDDATAVIADEDILKPEAEEAAAAEEIKEADPVEKEAAVSPAKTETKAVTYTKAISNVMVKAVVPENAFAEEVELAVRPLSENSSEYKEAEQKLAADGVVYDGMMAYDICFHSIATGYEVEPDGEVSVSMSLNKDALAVINESAVDPGSVTVLHITDGDVEMVADNGYSSDGSVRVGVSGDTVNSLSVDFKVDSLSPFVITWGDGFEATIHWGTYEDGVFKDFESSTTIDSTASSVDIGVIINAEDYYLVGAEYKLTEDATENAEESENLASTVLHKVDGAWQIKLETSGTVNVADGSHIYVNYAPYGEGGYTPPDPPGSDVLAPETEKNVTQNDDGTFTIRLDIKGKADHSTTQVGANVIVIMDITQSMVNSMPGGGTRMSAAKQALTTLINTLDPGTNLINFTAVNFGNSADYTNGVGWTQQRSAMEGYVSGLPDSPNDYGTCWGAGLQGGIDRVGTAPEGNETYVIFVTDGNPNGWVNAQGNYQQQGSGGFVQAAYNYAVPRANQLGTISHFYGVFCGDAQGSDHLEDLIVGANGSNENFINGSSTSAIETAFENIATTIVNNLGAGGVTVDDGVPTLSNVSANVSAGEAGGFKYYIKPALGEETEWTDAPGATYSQTNGVTWDLGEAGELQNGTIYSLEFTVWPSQEAYDLIADLNNGLKDYDDLPDEQKGAIEGSKETGYTLKTNTHLYTTFTDLDGNEYREVNDAKPAAMDLPTTTINVEKYWNNRMDAREATDVTLTVTKDGEDYFDIEMGEPEQIDEYRWEQKPTQEIYISYGQIIDGTVKETGHDYTVVEPPNFSYRWDLTADVFHPMIIDGVKTMLIKTDDPTGTEGEDYYTINDSTYQVSEEEANILTANNDRRSNLVIGKELAESDAEAPEDAVFAFTLTLDDVNGHHPGDEDYNEWYDTIWFAVMTDPTDRDTIIKEGVTVDGATAEEGNTGFYWFDNGGTVTVYIRAGWFISITNIARGTEYTIEELLDENMPVGFTFSEADSDAENRAGGTSTPATITGSKAEGTIDQPNTDYSVTYTNEYGETGIEVTKSWEDENDSEGLRPSAEEYADYISLLINGDESSDYDDNCTITDNKDNTYTITYTGLPMYIDNEEAEYAVQETTVPDDYEIEGEDTAADGGTITNKHEITLIDVSGKKTWVDDDNSGETRPESITINLMANGKKVDSKTVTEKDEWEWTFEGVKEKEAGKEIEYTVTEEQVSGYTATEEGMNVTNELLPPEVTEVKVTKVWEDEDNKYEIRPDSVTVDLYADGEVADTVELNEENSWMYTFKDLEKTKDGEDIEYTVDEQEVTAGYVKEISGSADEGYTITNTFEPTWGDPPVGKTVKGDPATDETFTFKLTAVSTTAEGLDGNMPMPEAADGAQEMTMDIVGSGEKEFGEFPFVIPGTYNYTIEEVKGDAEGYTYDETVYEIVYEVKVGEDNSLECVKKVNGKEVDEMTAEDVMFTNEYKKPEIEKIDINVNKVWSDDNDKDKIRPLSVTINLLADGKETGNTLVLNEDGEWKGTFKGLDKTKDGKEIEYTVEEKQVEGYVATISGDAKSGFTVTNTHTSTPVQPKTGDDSRLFLWFGIMAFCIAGLGIVALVYKLRQPARKHGRNR